MFTRAMAVLALLVAMTSAQAAEPRTQGAYIGGGFGWSQFDDDGAFTGLYQDDEDQATILFGGYKLFRYFAIEGRYSDFGELFAGGVPLDPTAVSVHAVGMVPFGTSGWELYGQLGYGNINFNIPFAGDNDQTAASGGIGIRFSPSQNISIGIQTDVFVWEDDVLGPPYDMSLGGTVLSARIIF